MPVNTDKVLKDGEKGDKSYLGQIKNIASNAQKWVKRNKSGLLSFADDLKQSGDNATTAGLEMAAIGVWFDGVGAAPGVIVLGVGELVSKTGAIVGIGVEIFSNDYSTNNTTDGISDQIKSFLINGTVDAAIPGKNPAKEIIKGYAGENFK